jgi:ribosome maturation factor RimP
MGAAEDLREALEPTVLAAGLSLWDVERSSSVVRVLVDRDGGLDLDAVSSISSAVSAFLDERPDLVPAGQYVLEVSSPGLERPLRRRDHFEQYVGSDVSLKTSEPVSGSRRLRGRLTAAGPEGISLSSEPGSGTEGDLSIQYSQIQRAHTVFAWGKGSTDAGSTRPDERATSAQSVPAATGGKVPKRRGAVVVPRRPERGEHLR